MDKKFSARLHCSQHIAEIEPLERKVRACPVIASLKSVNDALTKLTMRPDSSVTEIAEVISRDLSLTARLLRLVNSVFIGLANEVNSIEEAIFFLGLRQIRQMAMTTRVVEEMEAFVSSDTDISFDGFWRHSIATAIMTREILTMTNGVKDDDHYYISGLLSNLGKLVMMNTHPEQLKESLTFGTLSAREHLEMERAEFGFTHADLGALYLECNNLSGDIVETVLFHHEPELAQQARYMASGVQLADVVSCYAGCLPGFEVRQPVQHGDWEQLQGWKFLFSSERAGSQYAKASLLRSIDNLPSLLHGLLD